MCRGTDSPGDWGEVTSKTPQPRPACVRDTHQGVENVHRGPESGKLEISVSNADQGRRYQMNASGMGCTHPAQTTSCLFPTLPPPEVHGSYLGEGTFRGEIS